jgi:hypothetical protein
MKEVNSLHQKAMEVADQAAAARLAGAMDDYKRLTVEALNLEIEAAKTFAAESDLEPTRSVLFRSAATLAVECQELRIAEQLISTALAGNPPLEIADELRDLLEDVYFNRHLELRGVKLAPGEVQMMLEGDGVGFGMTRSDAFIQRVNVLETMLYRTAERLLERPFREAGRKIKKLAKDFELYLSVPRSASFAVTLKLSQSNQPDLPGVDDSKSKDTMKELLDNLEILNKGDIRALEKQIPDEPYRRNFIALAEKLSPDGSDIRTVGFTSVTGTETRKVALAIPRKMLRERIHRASRHPIAKTKEQEIQIQGTLLEADATKELEGVIRVVDSKGTEFKIHVPRGMMSDIVKPMFEEEVVVSAIHKGSRIDLVTIDLAESDEKSS